MSSRTVVVVLGALVLLAAVAWTLAAMAGPDRSFVRMPAVSSSGHD